MVTRKLLKYLGIVVLIGLLIGGAYIGYTIYKGRMEIKKLKKIIANLKEEKELLRVLVEDTVMNHYDIKVTFIDMDGKPSGGFKRYTLPGDKIYVEAIILQFTYPLVERGKRSIAFPVKIYSSSMEPDKGLPIVPLDERGMPLCYKESDSLNIKLKEYAPIFKKLWFFANNPDKIPERWGIKRIYGQAVFTKMKKGKYYRVIVKSSGDMAVEPADVWWE